MTLKHSQVTMYDHSEVKVRLLKLYLEKYLNILSRSQYVEDIHLFDLFCSEGIYENGGKGSPIIILETIKNIYFSNKNSNIISGKFHCNFNDIDSEKIAKLKSEVEKRKLHYKDIGECNYSVGNYREKLNDVISEISKFKNEKAFIFIDPYGYKDIKINDIRSLLKNKKCEVLLFLPTQFMFRFEKKGTPESLADFIEELIPKDKWPTSETGLDFIENLKDAFRFKLGSDFFVDSFIISRNVNQYFSLFFFTSHIYGFEKMLESKWDIDEENGRGWKMNSNNDLFSFIDKQPNIDKFELKLEKFLKNEHKSNGEVYTFTLRNGHLPKHTNQILKSYQDSGKLIAINSDNSKTRKSSFYINYRDFQSNPNKIFLKIK